ncbi:Sulfopropanediol 3-dehydrogenase [uncultured Eubacterium sp.]|uniref:histidinol dehydrogenase n=1 Tax=Brotomerdimonas butyrica TaxID=2981721 RepID=UPI00082292A1|nr:histidinol dehydrogenase [Brotomerdimonas butyrica]MCU6755486.1 histidinol dehydrogenase [Brotomerdimonas butyrica]SCH32295.1 Sulfopropanediol 3-dehydrogenase [uncultured Eubacterium sp.]
MIKELKPSKKRTEEDRSRLMATVGDIIADVRMNGDAALMEYNRRFDGCERTALRISEQEIRDAYDKVSAQEIEDIKKAAVNIENFAKAQRATVGALEDFSPSPGIVLGHRVIPVGSCCCYVPGGGYPLYSTALMLGIPAKVAGVERVTACSPVIKGTDCIHPKTLVAMDVAGVDEIYAVGGAQAIAAFSYGTDQIQPVDMIVGPGNSFVTEAKRQCYGKVGIDFVAGPSEVLIIADGNADPEVLAADILAQSEHDKEAKGILVTTDEKLGAAVIDAVEVQLSTLETEPIARSSWNDFGEILIADSLDEAVEYANAYAPEHLEVNVAEADADRVVSGLKNYGSLFIGGNTAEVFGDYASGPNHTLPTLGAARYTGGVWVGTFLKICTYQSMSRDAMMGIAPLVSNLARGEGLIGHARAAEIRMEKNK